MSVAIAVPELISSKIRKIFKMSDFPAPISNVITLEFGPVTYEILEDLTTSCRFSVPVGATVSFRGAAFNMTGIIYTGTGTFFTGSSVVQLNFFDMLLISTSTGTLFDITGNNPFSFLTAFTTLFNGWDSVGTVDEIRYQLFFHGQIECGGLILTNPIDMRVIEAVILNSSDTSSIFFTITGTNTITANFSDVTATTLTNEDIFDIDDSIASDSDIRIEDNAFLGAGDVFATGSLDQTDIRICSRGNSGLRDSRAIGSCISQGVDVPTTISAQGSGTSGYVDFNLDEQTGSITIFANNGSGGTTVTSTAHNMPNERLLNITGTTSYNGLHEIFNVAANTFDIDITFVADDATGTWTSGAFQDEDIERWELNNADNGELKYIGNEEFLGEYLVTISATTAAASAKRYKFRLVKNGIDGFSMPNEIKNTVTETTFRKGITAVKNDLFKMQVANFDSTANIIIDTFSAGIE